MKKILHLSKYFTPYVAGIEDVCLSVIQAIKGDCEQKCCVLIMKRKYLFEGKWS